MTVRYLISSRDFDSAIVWYVKDSRVPQGGEPAIVARCNNEAGARLVRDALNAWDERRKGGGDDRKLRTGAS